MAPPAFNDFGADCAGLFDDHHGQGKMTYSHAGKMGSGADYKINLSNANGADAVEWDFNTSIHGMEVKYDSANTLSKSLELKVKQVEGLTAKWDCSFNAASGLNLGSVNFNFANDKINANVSSTVDAAPSINFDAAFDTNWEGHVMGINGSFDAKSGAMGDIGFGVQQKKGNYTADWKAANIMNPSMGQGSFFRSLPGNKDFCCYGINIDSVAGNMSLAAATTCCDKNTMRYKLDHTGVMHVAKVQKLNQCMALNLSASLNMKDLAAGGHTFGCGLSWE